ncbi:MAG: hypothetical protein WD250_06805 [Egibacteraceae bacterium]
MPRASKASPALDALSNAERAAALDRLLDRRPDLLPEAEVVATELLTDVDRDDVADEVVDGLARTAAAGFTDAATDIGFGLLLGLYRLREGAGEDTLIGWCGADQESWELATSVVLAFDDAGLDPGSETVNALVPDWSAIA